MKATNENSDEMFISYFTDTIPLHEGKTPRVVRFQKVSEYPKGCSEVYWDKIVIANKAGQLWGAYLIKTGKIRATFV